MSAAKRVRLDAASPSSSTSTADPPEQGTGNQPCGCVYHDKAPASSHQPSSYSRPGILEEMIDGLEEQKSSPLFASMVMRWVHGLVSLDPMVVSLFQAMIATYDELNLSNGYVEAKYDREVEKTLWIIFAYQVTKLNPTYPPLIDPVLFFQWRRLVLRADSSPMPLTTPPQNILFLSTIIISRLTPPFFLLGTSDFSSKSLTLCTIKCWLQQQKKKTSN